MQLDEIHLPAPLCNVHMESSDNYVTKVYNMLVSDHRMDLIRIDVTTQKWRR